MHQHGVKLFVADLARQLSVCIVEYVLTGCYLCSGAFIVMTVVLCCLSSKCPCTPQRSEFACADVCCFIVLQG